jgi:hypothetical protein
VVRELGQVIAGNVEYRQLAVVVEKISRELGQRIFLQLPDMLERNACSDKGPYSRDSLVMFR